MSETRTVVTTCTRDCPNTCGLVATVENGTLVKLSGNPDHPYHRGLACTKTKAKYIDRVYSPERVTVPMICTNGRWRRATWDEALDLVAERMKTISDALGPEAILYYQGYGERTALKLLNKYFFNLLGGVTTLRGSLCGGTGQASQNMDFGERISHDPLDHYNSNSMILWARNPVSTNISLTPIMRNIRKRGGRVICIDPARTRTARVSDRHIAPRVGHDVYLAMAAAKRILEAGAEDRKFMDKHAEGAAEYEALLQRWSVEELADLAGVSVDDVDYLAETLMTQQPTSILLGWGLHRTEYAHHSIRAIDALGAVAGIIGVPGGGVSQGFEEYGPYDQQWWGDHLNPERRTLLMPVVGDEIANARNPEIRMIYVTASNPVCMAPNSEKVAEAFRKAEFVVYSGHFLDDTAEYADVFLPATTFLEEHDVMATYGHNYVGPVNRAIEPVGETKSEFRMFYELASRFPFANKFQRTADEWLQDICAPIWETGATMEDLRKGPVRMDEPMAPYQDKTFPTPSGRFRFMRSFDPAEVAGPDPEYPYQFLTVAPHGYIVSERTMAEHEPLPPVFQHPDEVAKLGLQDGETVRLVSPVGSARAVLHAKKGMRRDVLAAERGGWIKAGHGLNLLTRDMASKVGQGTPYYETRVRVEPLFADGDRAARILVVQNSEGAVPAGVGRELTRRGAAMDIIHAYAGDSVPTGHEGYDALLVLGGPQYAGDDEAGPYFQPLMQLMRDYDAASKPVLSICLGCQLLARAHGGVPGRLDELELGYIALTPTEAGKADPVLGPALPLPRVFEFHQDTFTLPPTATLLATGEDCANQGFAVGNCSWGFQFHFESGAVEAATWLTKFRDGGTTYTHHRTRFDDAFFDTTLAELPGLTAATDIFCRKLTAAWLQLVEERRQT